MSAPTATPSMCRMRLRRWVLFVFDQWSLDLGFGLAGLEERAKCGLARCVWSTRWLPRPPSPISPPARVARNPRTGLAVALPARHAAYFKPGSKLRERVNRGG